MHHMLHILARVTVMPRCFSSHWITQDGELLVLKGGGQ